MLFPYESNCVFMLKPFRSWSCLHMTPEVGHHCIYRCHTTNQCYRPSVCTMLTANLHKFSVQCRWFLSAELSEWLHWKWPATSRKFSRRLEWKAAKIMINFFIIPLLPSLQQSAYMIWFCMCIYGTIVFILFSRFLIFVRNDEINKYICIHISPRSTVSYYISIDTCFSKINIILQKISLHPFSWTKCW